MVFSYALFYYLQEENRREIKLQVFEKQKDEQLASTDSVAKHIGSDLTLILSYLDGIANSKYLQDGDFYGIGIKQLTTQKYSQMNNIVDKLFILNNKDIVVFGVSNSTNVLAPVGDDLTFRPWVAETKNSLHPVFSQAFQAVGQYRVFITVPVINRETGQYLGMVGVSVPTVNFFKHYGNVNDINSQFLVAYDKKGTILAAGADQSLVGLNYFGEDVQAFVNHNPALNSHTAKLLEGQSGSVVYDYGKGERLTTYQPIYIGGLPTYFLQVVTPTVTIYSQIDAILSNESGKLFLLFVATVVAATIFVILLLFWNSFLRKEVARRTIELKNSNKLLAASNEQLKERDRLQKEFLDVAAHEMRTPLQPILGFSDFLREKLLKIQYIRAEAVENDQNKQQLLQSSTFLRQSSDLDSLEAFAVQMMDILDIINRNAQRLDKLSSNLLDVSRIENNSLKLNKEKIDLNEKIKDIAIDMNSSLNCSQENIKIIFEPFGSSIIIYADKSRLFEVISNLVNNAIKFTREGTITIKSELQNGYAIVSVKDAGAGINSEILPKLFTKFATKSEKGIGLGLFISKNIVEAHGGKMWAQNNPDGKGSTFTFSLPIKKEEESPA